jgi:enoyl-CoA hydratase/carnithine racemase
VDADPLARAMAIAHEIALQSPHAVRASKLLCNRMPELSADDMLMAESIAQHELMYSKNQKESVMAGMERRAGIFDDP